MIRKMEYIPNNSNLYTKEAASKFNINNFEVEEILRVCSNGHKYPYSMGLNCPLCEQFLYEKINYQCTKGHLLIAVGPGEEIPSCQVCRITSNEKVNGDYEICENGHRWRKDIQKLRKREKREKCPVCEYKKMSPIDKMTLQKCCNGHRWPRNIQKRNIECPICRIDRHAIRELKVCKNGHKLPGCMDDKTKCPICCRDNYTPAISFIICPKGHKIPKIKQNEKKNKGCPICNYESYHMADINPLLQEDKRIYASERNGDLKENMLSYRSNYYVWWKCKENHYWVSSVSGHNSCPYCMNQLARKGENDLKKSNPYITREWCEEYNGDLQPSDIMLSSNIKFYLKCENDHIYVKNNIANSECPFCTKKLSVIGVNDLGTFYPRLVDIYDECLNGDMKLEHLTSSSAYCVWLRCENGHRWVNNPNTLSRRDGIVICPYCKIIETHDDKWTGMLNEWDKELNGDVDLNFLGRGSCYRGVWKCEKNHRWIASISDKKGCPYCNGNIISKEDSLDEKLSCQLHPILNGSLKKEHLMNGSNINVWWLCDKGHVWKISPNQRKTNGCPFCSGKKPDKNNNLKTKNPQLAQIIYKDMMGDVDAAYLMASSTKKIWFKCNLKGHIFEAKLNYMKSVNYCPYCGNKKPVIGENDLNTLFPEIYSEWDFKKNKCKPEKYTCYSSQKVWWICNGCLKSYYMSICNRTKKGYGCSCRNTL